MGYELSNASFVEGVSLPWLQDTSEDLVWETWAVDYRDVVILDPAGRLREVYNLTEHDLSVTENYEALKSILLEP